MGKAATSTRLPPDPLRVLDIHPNTSPTTLSIIKVYLTNPDAQIDRRELHQPHSTPQPKAVMPPWLYKSTLARLTDAPSPVGTGLKRS